MRIQPVQSPAVPELPDLDIVADALHAALSGRPLSAVRAPMPLAVRGTPAERHPGELKNLLRNRGFVDGIGNAYSDEILFAARLHPFRKRSTLAAEEIDELYAAMRAVRGHAGHARVVAPRTPRARPSRLREAGP